MSSEFLGLIAAAFFAGLVDAVAGGGGLIQVPALFSALPDVAPATLFGTNKISAIFGTASAALRYLRRTRMVFAVVMPAAVSAFFFSVAGAACLIWFPPALIRPLVLILLILVVIYVVWQPHMGLTSSGKPYCGHWIWPAATGAMLGFYDGFFGPGTGSFLIFFFVRFFRMNFIEASGSAKWVNLATNAGALSFLLPNGQALFVLGGAMAVANILGAQLGARAALRGGSRWVRRVFLLVSGTLIAKIAFDVIR